MSILRYPHGFEVETAVLLSKTQGSAFVSCSEVHFKTGIQYTLSPIGLETHEMKMQVGNGEYSLFNHIRTQQKQHNAGKTPVLWVQIERTVLGKNLAFLFGHQASARNCKNYHRANGALKKKSDELEVRLIQNNAFLGELGDLEVREWYFLKNNFSATSGPF